MYFALSEDQKLFATTVRNLLSEDADPARLRQAWRDQLPHPNPLWANLAEMGVLGLCCPEEFGGLGLGPKEWIVVFEEAGRAALPDPLLESMLLGTGLLAQCADDVLKNLWLPKLAAGETTVSVSLKSEAFVLAADKADLVLIEHEDALYALKAGQFALQGHDSVDASRRLFELSWEPKQHEPFAKGEIIKTALAEARDRAALATSAQLLGLSQHILDTTIEYVKTRTQFGRAIGSFQAIKHKLADAWIKLEFARPVVYRAAHSLAHQRKEAPIHIAMAKAYASELGLHASKTALQCHGAIGYSFEYDLHLWMKRAWALSACFGDAAHHRAVIAETILDQDHYEDLDL